MKSQLRFTGFLAAIGLSLTASLLIDASLALHAQQPGRSAASASGQDRGRSREQGGGMGVGMVMGGRGVEGTITAATATELTVKTELGETYKIQFNENTHFMKDRQPIKAREMKVGDSIMAAGNIDADSRTVGAAFIVALDAEQVKRIHEARASYGKTWLAGKITAIDETRITINGANGKPASLVVDESTSFKKRKESITLADVKVGDSMTARGELKAGSFVVTEFQLMTPHGDRGSDGESGGGANGDHGSGDGTVLLPGSNP